MKIPLIYDKEVADRIEDANYRYCDGLPKCSNIAMRYEAYEEDDAIYIYAIIYHRAPSGVLSPLYCEKYTYYDFTRWYDSSIFHDMIYKCLSELLKEGKTNV